MSARDPLPPRTEIVVWHHVGKEHGRGGAIGIQRNSPGVVDAYLTQKLDRARSAGPNGFWHGDLLVEVTDTEAGGRSLIVYDGASGLQVSRGKKGHRWLIDVIALESPSPNLYMAKDLLIDIAVGDRPEEYEILDLDEFADALEAGVIESPLAAAALRSLHQAMAELSSGRLPIDAADELWNQWCS